MYPLLTKEYHNTPVNTTYNNLNTGNLEKAKYSEEYDTQMQIFKILIIMLLNTATIIVNGLAIFYNLY